jgi:hypothetical protein
MSRFSSNPLALRSPRVLTLGMIPSVSQQQEIAAGERWMFSQ